RRDALQLRVDPLDALLDAFLLGLSARDLSLRELAPDHPLAIAPVGGRQIREPGPGVGAAALEAAVEGAVPRALGPDRPDAPLVEGADRAWVAAEVDADLLAELADGRVAHDEPLAQARGLGLRVRALHRLLGLEERGVVLDRALRLL